MGNFLGLRTCRPDGTSYGGFVWPAEGPVEFADWDAKPICGHGGHALLWGVGDGSLLNWSRDARWQVVCFDEYVDLGNKVKFPRCTVLHTGSRESATSFLLPHVPSGSAVVGALVAVGDGGTATAGFRGTATAGHGGTATAGDEGTATAGDEGTATAGDGGTATAGDGGELRIRWWDGRAQRYRTAISYIGEDGILPGILYRLDADHKFTPVKK